MSSISRQKNVVGDLFAETFSTAVDCFTRPCIRVSDWCETDLESFRVAKETVVRQIAKPALNAGTVV